MSRVASLGRQVPTLTEVLEEGALSALPGFRVVPQQTLDLDLDLDLEPNALAGADEQLRQAIMAVVDATMAEFRCELLARLEPLLGRAAPPSSGADSA